MSTFLLGIYIWDEVILRSKALFWVLLATENASLGLHDMKDVSCVNTRWDLVFTSNSAICSSWIVGHQFRFFLV